jgi:hypothetical protein
VIKISRLFCALALVVVSSAAGCAGTAAQDCRPERPVELAVTPMGNVPIVSLVINGSPANFLFDTGAERTILTAPAARRLGVVPHYEYARRMRSIGGAVAGGDARLRTLDLGGRMLSDVRVLVGSVSLPMLGEKPIDGLLGADFLSDFEVDLDLARRRVILYQAPSCRIAAPAWGAPYATIKANRSLHDRLFFPVGLDGHRLAEVVKSRAHRFTQLDIDGEILRDPVIVVASLGLQDADLVLGADFLRSHRVWLSYRSQLIFVGRP